MGNIHNNREINSESKAQGLLLQTLLIIQRTCINKGRDSIHNTTLKRHITRPQSVITIIPIKLT